MKNNIKNMKNNIKNMKNNIQQVVILLIYNGV